MKGAKDFSYRLLFRRNTIGTRERDEFPFIPLSGFILIPSVERFNGFILMFVPLRSVMVNEYRDCNTL